MSCARIQAGPSRPIPWFRSVSPLAQGVGVMPPQLASSSLSMPPITRGSERKPKLLYEMVGIVSGAPRGRPVGGGLKASCLQSTSVHPCTRFSKSILFPAEGKKIWIAVFGCCTAFLGARLLFLYCETYYNRLGKISFLCLPAPINDTKHDSKYHVHDERCYGRHYSLV